MKNLLAYCIALSVAELAAFANICTNPTVARIKNIAIIVGILLIIILIISHLADPNIKKRQQHTFLKIFLATPLATLCTCIVGITGILYFPAVQAKIRPDIAKIIRQKQIRQLNALNKGSFRILVKGQQNNQPYPITTFTSKEQQTPIPKNFCQTETGMLFCKAILAAEDHEFFANHKKGRPFSINGIGRALWLSIKKATGKYHGQIKGGSGIALQLAKLLQERTHRLKTKSLQQIINALQQKIHELYDAYHLTRNFSAEEILRAYINMMPAVDGNRGFPLAYKAMFGNKENCPYCLVYLAGSIKAPAQYRPWTSRGQRKGRQRANWILQQLKRHFPETPVPSQATSCAANARCLQGVQKPTKETVSAFRQFVRERLIKRGIWDTTMQLSKPVGVLLTINKDAQEALQKTMTEIASNAQREMKTEQPPTVCAILAEQRTIRAAGCSDNRSNFLFENQERRQGNRISMGSFSKLFWAYTIMKHNYQRTLLPFPNNQGSTNPVTQQPNLFLWNGGRNYQVKRDHPTADSGYLGWGIQRSENQMAIAGPRWIIQGLKDDQLRETIALGMAYALQWQIRFAQAKSNRRTSEAVWLARNFGETRGSFSTRIASLPMNLRELKEIAKQILDSSTKLQAFMRIFVRSQPNPTQIKRTWLRYELAQLYKDNSNMALSAILYTGNPEQYEKNIAEKDQRLADMEEDKQDTPYNEWSDTKKKEYKTINNNIKTWKERIQHFKEFAKSDGDEKLKQLYAKLNKHDFNEMSLENLSHSEAFTMYVGVHLIAYEIERLSGYNFPVNIPTPNPPQPSMILGSHGYTLEEATKALVAMTGAINPRELGLIDSFYNVKSITGEFSEERNIPNPIQLPQTKWWEHQKEFDKILHLVVHPTTGWGTASVIRKQVPWCVGGKTGTSQDWITATAAISFCGQWSLVISLDKRQIGGIKIPDHRRKKVQGSFLFKAAPLLLQQLGGSTMRLPAHP